MVVSGETADISPFCKFGFWDCVKFCNKGVAFPDNQLVLDKYLGPSIDVGPAMTQHVVNANGEYEVLSTVCPLTPKEHMSLAMQKEQDAFLSSVTECWNPKTMIKDLGPDILNLITDPMNNDS